MTIRVATETTTTVKTVMEVDPEDVVDMLRASPELAVHFVRAGMDAMKEADPETQGQIMSNIFQAIAKTDPRAYADMCGTMARAGMAAMVQSGPQLWLDMMQQGRSAPFMMLGGPHKKDGP